MERGKSGLSGIDVSRETLNRLEEYERLLKKWNKSINLVSSSTIGDVWHRHFLDSAQLLRHAEPTPSHWVDLGSGGGLPGLVIAIILTETSPETEVTLIESDQRKATFLRTAVRELGLKTEINHQRIEDVSPLQGNILSARALAPLSPLLAYVDRHLAPRGTALLLKGQNAQSEIESARKDWIFDCTSHTSMTDPNASILEIKGLKRA